MMNINALNYGLRLNAKVNLLAKIKQRVLLPALLLGFGLSGYASADHLNNDGMTGDELKSLKKAAKVMKHGGGLKDSRLDLSEADMKWWQDAKFGMFIHWGLYAVPAQGEWYMHKKKVPAEEYAKLADEFKGKDFDAKEWAQVAKDAGMKYMVLTARHHDGYSLWDSPESIGDFTSAKRAAKRDFVKEYVEATREAGLGVGLYYSPMDWRIPGYWKPKELKESAAELKQQTYGQLEELMSNYGDIDVLWYDGAWLAHKGSNKTAAWLWEPLKLNKMVRQHQPKVVMNDRSGWEGNFRSAEGNKPVKGPILDFYWEKCLNLNRGGWGYHTKNREMTPQQVIKMLVDVVTRGGNMLLNVGPDANGVIPAKHVNILKRVGHWMEQYGDTIYGTKAGPFQPVDNVYGATQKGDHIYVYVNNPMKNATISYRSGRQCCGCGGEFGEHSAAISAWPAHRTR